MTDARLLQDWERAARSFAEGRHADAAAALAAILERDPDSAQAWLALARVDIQAGRVRQASAHASRAAACAAAEPRLLCDIATALLTVGAATAARDCMHRAAAAAPRDPQLRQRIGLEFQNLNEHAEALAWMQRAREAGLADFPSRFCLAVQLVFHGRMQEAELELEACQAAEPPLGRAMVQLAQLHRQRPGRNHLASLEHQWEIAVPGGEDRAALDFARYKELEDLGRDEDAWHALERANGLMHALLGHDPAAERRTVEALMDTAARLRAPRAVQHASPVPIFIVGMPRTGTTLLDRMLGNHPLVRPAGELGTFRRNLEHVVDRFTGPMLDEDFVARLPGADLAELGALYLANSAWCARGRPFYVDKLPRNWLLVPLIRLALPQARILHMVRAPMDTVFSNYRSYFGRDYPYCYDQDTLVAHYSLYRRAVAHWHATLPGTVLDVSYARLVADPDAELRRVFTFCGLPWEPGCSDLARNREPVATLSASQVRGSLQPEFSERWRRYAGHLAELERKVAAAGSA